jgi:hypothetical protein
MAQERFLIAPSVSGIVQNVRSWLIPDDAFFSLKNLYVWRGFVRKRVGAGLLYGNTAQVEPQLISRLRVQVGVTVGGGLVSTVPGASFHIGQMFSIGDQMFTVYQLGAPAAMLFTGVAVTATYDTTNGNFDIAGTGQPDGMTVYFYPADPVMNFFTLFTNTLVRERYLAFDEQFAYEIQPGGGWRRLDTGAATWTGSDSDFYSAANFSGITDYDFFLFVVNNTAADGIRYLDATTNTWVQYARSYSSAANTEILTCAVVIQFKNRLLLLNTLEEDGGVGTQRRYQSRCRYSSIGGIAAVEAFYEPPGFYGRGGFVDAPTKEEIVGAQILKDRLIVYFEYSTWELVYQNNEIAPFKWISINIELGAQSSNSIVPFDAGILGIANIGIHTCNGTNVNRIDLQIPDQVYTIRNEQEGPQRVAGVRDYEAELVYWTFPSIYFQVNNATYPNRIFVYNYRNNTWAIFEDSITAFGYIQLTSGLSWGNLDYILWENAFNHWGDGDGQSFKQLVVAGNQEGYTFYMDKDVTQNAPGLQISNIFTITHPDSRTTRFRMTIFNHNLAIGAFLLLESIQEEVTIPAGNLEDMNGHIVLVTDVFTTNAIEVTLISTANPPVLYDGIYVGGGTCTLVSNIYAETKQYNFYIDKGVNFSVNKLDMLVTKVNRNMNDPADTGSVLTILFNPNTGHTSPSSTELSLSAYDPIFYPYEQFQSRLWHTVYPNITGSFIQLEIGWTGAQVLDTRISLANVEIHAMLFYTEVTDSRLQ